MTAKFYPKPAHFESKSSVAPNSMVFNKELKDREKILLLALNAISTCAPTWEVCQTDLAKRLGWGEDKMTAAIKACRKLGYIKTRQKRNCGQYGQNEFEFCLDGSYSKNNDNISQEKCPHNECEPTGYFPEPEVPAPESPELPRSIPRSLTKSMKDLGQKMTPNVHKSKPETLEKTLAIDKSKIKTLDCCRRWNLSEEEVERFNYLKTCNIDAEDKKLCYWAKNFSMQRLIDVYNEAKHNKARSLRMYMSKLLDEGKTVFNARIEANTLFARDFMYENNWHEPKIYKKYLKVPMGNDYAEINLDIDSKDFIRILLEKYDNSQK